MSGHPPKAGTSRQQSRGLHETPKIQTQHRDNDGDELEDYSDSQDESEISWSDPPSEGEIREPNPNNMTFVCETLCHFGKEGAKYLSFDEGEMITVVAVREDEWWKAENAEGKRGLVPSTFLKVPNKVKKYLKASRDAGRSEQNQFWDRLRKVVHKEESYDMSWLTDHSTLSRLLKRDPKYSTKAYLLPTTDMFGRTFGNMHWNRFSLTLKCVPLHLQKFMKLVAFRDIFQPPLKYEVTSRHVRMCLHDGSKVLSNIHTVKAKWDPKSPKIWTFDQKCTVDSNSEEEGHVFIRSSRTRTTLGILFELCLTFKKENVEDYREMSCGWVFVRLLNDDGFPVSNKTKVIKVNRGAPFSCPEPLPTSYEKESALINMMNRNKAPRIVVTFYTPNRAANKNLSYLPYTLIGRVSSITMILLYRMQLAEAVVENRSSVDTLQLFHSPFLANFPRVIDEPDLYDVFRKIWYDNNKREMPYFAKRREDARKSIRTIFMESVFLILQSSSFLPYSIGNSKTEQERKFELARLYNIITDDKVFAPMSAAIEYKPISSMILTTPLCRPSGIQNIGRI